MLIFMQEFSVDSTALPSSPQGRDHVTSVVRLTDGSLVMFYMCFCTLVSQLAGLRLVHLAVCLVPFALSSAWSLIRFSSDRSEVWLVFLVLGTNLGLWGYREHELRQRWRLQATCRDWQNYHNLASV